MKNLAINGGTPVRNTSLQAEYLGASLYGAEEMSALERVIKAKSPFRYYGLDCQKLVSKFETKCKQKFGIQNALGVSSGTAALIVALKAAGVGAGDKVIVPAVTFIATAGTVVCAGAVPVFADCDDSLNINPDEISRLADKYTKAVIPVPLLGNSCRMDKIISEAKKHKLVVIEDVAQSMGSKFNGKYSGTMGDIGCFSMQLNKVLTTGEGGMVCTNNENYFERACRFHDQGMYREKEGFLNTVNSENLIIGQNYRMSELTGAVASEQILKLDWLVENCRRVFRSIMSKIQPNEHIQFRKIVDEEGFLGTSILAFASSTELAAQIRVAISKENVPCGYLYNGKPLYLNPQIFYQRTADVSGFPFNQFEEPVVYSEGMCPTAEDLMSRNIHIPLSPTFTEQDCDDVANAFNKVVLALCSK